MGLKPRSAPPRGYPTVEFRGGGSSKFWAVTVLGSRVISSHGRIGTKGQTSIKDFPDKASARAYAQKTFDSKLKKGYVPAAEKDEPTTPTQKPPLATAPKGSGMSYEEFIKGPLPKGLSSSEWNSFPLWFDDHESIIGEADTFSVIDDFMSDLGMDDFAEQFDEHFPNYRGLAACAVDVATAKQPDFAFDSYAEFFLCVDISKPNRPVLLWTGEGQFETLFPSFSAFHASLSEWMGS